MVDLTRLTFKTVSPDLAKVLAENIKLKTKSQRLIIGLVAVSVLSVVAVIYYRKKAKSSNSENLNS